MAATQREPFNPPHVRFTVTTWGTGLRNVRVKADISHREIATHLGVQKGLVKAWEDGEGFPNGYQLKGLYKMKGMHALRAFGYLLPTSEQNQVAQAEALDRAPGTPPPPPPPLAIPDASLQEIDQPRDFPSALRLARQVHGFHQYEIATLVEVEQGSVSRWELGDTNPIQLHYDRLVDLFPELRDVRPPPGIRNIPKPVGNAFPNTGAPSSSEPSADSPPRAQLAAVAIPAPSPKPADITPLAPSLTPVEQAGLAYARAMMAQRAARHAVEDARRALADAERVLADAEGATSNALRTLNRLIENTPNEEN